MRIDQLRLRNFRRFDTRTVELDPQFNVLIGNNGRGKSTILDALAVGAGSFFLGIDTHVPRQIDKNDVRHRVFVREELPQLEPQFPCEVECRGEVAGQELHWTRSVERLDGSTTYRNAKKLQKLAAQQQRAARSDADVLLPVIAYYGTGRLWLLKNLKKDWTSGLTSRLDGYLHCLEPASNFKFIETWIRKQEIAGLQNGGTVPQLEAIRLAIQSCIDGCKRFWFDVRFDELRVELEQSDSAATEIVPFSQLSDGYRNAVGMIADIAWRCAHLNPQFGKDAARKTPGVVLIDEIDLHLHPRWQRRIVEDLRQTFPRVQFVATTHSPFIIQSLEHGELIRLDGEIDAEYANESIEDIAENVQAVELPQRSEKHRKMFEAAKEYFQLVEQLDGKDSQEVEALKKRLDQLSAPYSDNPAYHAFLEMEKLAAIEKNS